MLFTKDEHMGWFGGFAGRNDYQLANYSGLKERIRLQNNVCLFNGRQCPGFDFGLFVFQRTGKNKERVELIGAQILRERRWIKNENSKSMC